MAKKQTYEQLEQQVTLLQEKLAAKESFSDALTYCKERFMMLVDQSPMPIQIHGVDGVMHQANRAWQSLWGVNAEEVVGRFNILADEQAKQQGIQAIFDQVGKGEAIALPPFEYDPSQSGCQGSKHWARSHVYPLKGDDGTVQEVLILHEDITETKQTEERYNIFVENTNEAIIVVQDGLVKFFNNKALDIAGYQEEDYSDKPFVNFVHPDHRHELAERHRLRVQGKQVPSFYQTKIIHQDGHSIWLQLNVTQVDWEGKPASLAFIYDINEQKKAEDELYRYRDHLEELVRERTATLEKVNNQLRQEIEERKRIEMDLRESEEKFRTLFSFSPQAVSVTDLSTGKFVDVNENFCSLSKLSRQEIVGKSTVELGFYSEKERARIIEELARSGEVDGIEMDFSIIDGSKRKGLLFAKLVQVKEKNYALAQVQDITERKQLEASLRQARKMEAIGTLAAGIAHDFNNILNTIYGYIQVLMPTVPLESPVRQHLQGIDTASKRAAEIVKQILTFSRHSEQTKQPLRLQSLLAEEIQLFRQTVPEAIEIHEQINRECEMILAEGAQIGQAVTNLLTNAVHPGTGQPHPNMAFGRYAQLTISDTGHGMDKATMERIFEPYFTTKNLDEGTGLGLAIVHGIVENHNGFIITKSNADTGTRFDLFFPIHVEQYDTPKEEKDRVVITRNKARIMLVDDEKMSIEVWEIALEQAGYQVYGFDSSPEAYAAFERSPTDFDVVITDYRMPHLNGIELAEKMLAVRPDIPIIMTTGWNDLLNENEARGVGIQELLSKPHKIEDLCEAIDQSLAGLQRG